MTFPEHIEHIKALYDIYMAHPAVTTDSRNVVPGSLFFALRGPSFDGNRFAAAALGNGAACAVVDDEGVISEYASEHPEADISERFFLTGNVLETMQALASYHRRKLGIPILAITGTNGKTTTKELAAAVLAGKYKVSYTQGNLNNHIGVPLTLLSMTGSTDFGIVEMGAGAQGEIKLLAETAAPDWGLITNIGRAHLEGFGGEEGVRKGKGDLYDYLAANGGTAIVRGDDPVLAGMVSERKNLKTVHYDSGYADGMVSRLEGDYNRFNISAAVAVGRIFDIPDTDIRSAVGSYMPENHRSQRIDTGRNIVIADCYNANPSSMAAAIRNLSARNETGPDGLPMKKIAVLGDMMELGPWAAVEHRRIAELALESDFDRILFVGNNFSGAIKSISSDAHVLSIKTFPDTAGLREYLESGKVFNYTILVKGSRSVRLEEALGAL